MQPKFSTRCFDRLPICICNKMLTNHHYFSGIIHKKPIIFLRIADFFCNPLIFNKIFWLACDNCKLAVTGTPCLNKNNRTKILHLTGFFLQNGLQKPKKSNRWITPLYYTTQIQEKNAYFIKKSTIFAKIFPILSILAYNEKQV